MLFLCMKQRLTVFAILFTDDQAEGLRVHRQLQTAFKACFLHDVLDMPLTDSIDRNGLFWFFRAR